MLIFIYCYLLLLFLLKLGWRFLLLFYSMFAYIHFVILLYFCWLFYASLFILLSLILLFAFSPLSSFILLSFQYPFNIQFVNIQFIIVIALFLVIHCPALLISPCLNAARCFMLACYLLFIFNPSLQSRLVICCFILTVFIHCLLQLTCSRSIAISIYVFMFLPSTLVLSLFL